MTSATVALEEIKKEVADSKERLKAAEDALEERQTIHDSLLKKYAEITGKMFEGEATKDYIDDLKGAEAKKDAAEVAEKGDARPIAECFFLVHTDEGYRGQL